MRIWSMDSPLCRGADRITGAQSLLVTWSRILGPILSYEVRTSDRPARKRTGARQRHTVQVLASPNRCRRIIAGASRGAI